MCLKLYKILGHSATGKVTFIPKKIKYHIISRGEKWALKKEGNKRASFINSNIYFLVNKWCDTKGRSDLFIHHKNGGVIKTIIKFN